MNAYNDVEGLDGLIFKSLRNIEGGLEMIEHLADDPKVPQIEKGELTRSLVGLIKTERDELEAKTMALTNQNKVTGLAAA